VHADVRHDQLRLHRAYVTAWNGWSLTYDGEGRLASACKVAGCATGDMVTMRYDADGRRVELVTRPNGGSATTTTFRYQGDALAQELTGTGTPTVVRTYVTDESGAIVKFCDPDCGGSNPQYLVTWSGHGDALGIWKINADATLTLANSFSYSAWGTPTTTTHNSYADLGFRFLYVGRYRVAWDNAFGLGLEYMGARHYSPALGRFLQPDPSAAEANLYGYAGNSPVSREDSSGTCFQALILWLGGPVLGIGGQLVCWAAVGLLAAGSVNAVHSYNYWCGRGGCRLPRGAVPTSRPMDPPPFALRDHWSTPWRGITVDMVKKTLLEREARDRGFRPVGQTRHGERWGHPDGRWTVIPRHNDIPPGTARNIRNVLDGGRGLGGASR
jgi:RHS repeat-associated protein